MQGKGLVHKGRTNDPSPWFLRSRMWPAPYPDQRSPVRSRLRESGRHRIDQLPNTSYVLRAGPAVDRYHCQESVYNPPGKCHFPIPHTKEANHGSEPLQSMPQKGDGARITALLLPFPYYMCPAHINWAYSLSRHHEQSRRGPAIVEFHKGLAIRLFPGDTGTVRGDGPRGNLGRQSPAGGGALRDVSHYQLRRGQGVDPILPLKTIEGMPSAPPPMSLG